MLHKHRGNRRRQNWIKAKRKEKITREIYGCSPLNEEGWHYYNNLNSYSKNKIHCSCPLCASKTNNKKHICYGKAKNYKISEQRNLLKLTEQLKEFI